MAAKSVQQETTVLDVCALLDAGDGALVTVVAGETRLAAHRAVLVAGSPVFSAMFSHDTLEAATGEVAIPDVEGPVLRQLLGYLYTGRAPQLLDMAPELLVAADKYGVAGLKDCCEQQLARQLSVETAAAAAVLALRHGCSSLKEATVTFIRDHTHTVMATEGWAEAVRKQPEEAVELSRLLVQQPAETSDAASADSRPAAAARSTAPPPDAAAVARFRSLSAGEKGRRLRKAAKQGAVQEVRALLAAGAVVGAADRDRWTALHEAAEGRQLEAARVLLEAGAAVGARDNSQGTALHLAAVKGHTPLVRLLLLQAHAEPNARDCTGSTPLHRAAYSGHAEAAAALLEAGADRGATDNYGETALDVARRRNHQQLMQLLQ